MGQEKQKAIVIKEFKQIPVFEETIIYEPKAGEVKIKVIASTINPSDRIRANGDGWVVNPPFVGGFEGYGEIVKAGSP
jgi:D-arabinose 1-dehydrogenase-like Zn-dependent alcohol dehydrogenase